MKVSISNLLLCRNRWAAFHHTLKSRTILLLRIFALIWFQHGSSTCWTPSGGRYSAPLVAPLPRASKHSCCKKWWIRKIFIQPSSRYVQLAEVRKLAGCCCTARVTLHLRLSLCLCLYPPPPRSLSAEPNLKKKNQEPPHWQRNALGCRSLEVTSPR